MSHDETSAPALLDTAGGVAAITLNRPSAFNAVTIEMLDLVTGMIEDAAADPAVRLITITGAGKAFCAGADLVKGLNPDDPVPDSGLFNGDLIDAANRVTVAIQQAPQVVVGLVNGAAAGVGATFALATDIAVGSSKAFLKTGFDAIGLMPDGGGTALLTASLGRSRAIAAAVLGDAIDAEEALRAGLFARVWPAEDFASESAAFVDSLATGPTRAFNAAKLAINTHALGATLPRALEIERLEQRRLLASDDFAAGVRAFQAKERPHFTGR